MPPAGSEPTIPASERPQTHVLDRATTGIGSSVGDNPTEISNCHLEHTEDFGDALATLRKSTFRIIMSVCLSAWENSAPAGRIFHEILYLRMFKISVEKIQI
jgi:hypothetical protein